jgi:hypothetical protein
MFVNLDFFTIFLVMFCFYLLCSWAESAVSVAEKKCIFCFDSAVAKNVNFELNGDKFFMMSISKIMVPLWSWTCFLRWHFFHICKWILFAISFFFSKEKEYLLITIPQLVFYWWRSIYRPIPSLLVFEQKLRDRGENYSTQVLLCTVFPHIVSSLE